jgi:hypothetical protein
MNIRLVPADFDWMVDARLRQALLDRFRDRVDQSIRDATLQRAMKRGTADVKVMDVGNAIEVQIQDRDLAALEKGKSPGQMVHLEGSTVPIQTPSGPIFRKATRLSMILGKWNSKGVQKRELVKGAIDKAFADSGDAVMEARDEVQGNAPPRVRDILGIGNGRAT